MFDVLLWISIVLSLVVLIQSVWFLVLSLKYLKKREENNEKNKKDKKNQKQVLASASLLLFGIFPIPLTVFCLLLLIEVGLLCYAIVYMTKKLKESGDEKKAEPVIVSTPAPEPEPKSAPEPEGPTEEEIVMVSELVRETITIEEAHSAITDEVAVHFIKFEKSDSKEKKYSKKSIINIDTLSDRFAAGQTVNLDSLKAKGLIPGGSDFVKVLARGHLDKKLTVEAQDFSADAVKMIILTGGKVIEKV